MENNPERLFRWIFIRILFLEIEKRELIDHGNRSESPGSHRVELDWLDHILYVIVNV